MRTESLPASRLLTLLQKEKIATLVKLKKTLGTDSSVTVFRKLKELNYLSSCSHSGKYYSLKRITRFNNQGLCFLKEILFSNHGTLVNTIKVLIEESKQGYSSIEIEKILNLKPNEALLNLLRSKQVKRKKISGRYIYFSSISECLKQQELHRNDIGGQLNFNTEVLMCEVKASIIIFYSTLNEQQRRLYAGLESMKIGCGGDNIISKLLGINVKTISKGRRELLNDSINIDTVRKKGGGRNEIQKKRKCDRKN